MSFEKLKEKKKGKREKDGKEEVKVGCHEYLKTTLNESWIKHSKKTHVNVTYDIIYF